MSYPDTDLIESLPSSGLVLGESIGSNYSDIRHIRTHPYKNLSLPDLIETPAANVIEAITSSHSAFKSGCWRKKTIHERAHIISHAFKKVRDKSLQLASYDALETGRSLNSLSQDSLPKSLETANWFAHAISHLHGKSYLDTVNNFDASTNFEPLGVCLCILPWNDPLVLFSWKVLPALLMGNSVIVKPSERSSASAIFVASILHESGVPVESLHVVTGRSKILFDLLLQDKSIAAISLTGSTRTALYAQRVSSQSSLKKLSFECGGKSPFLVTQSNSPRSLKKAAAIIAKNAFYNQGQICSAATFLISASSVYASLVDHVLDYSSEYLPNNPFDLSFNTGVMCIPDNVKICQSSIEKARKANLKILQPKRSYNNVHLLDCSLPPTIICIDADQLNSPGFSWLKQEFFGPLLVAVRCTDSLNDLISLANSTDYGLASGIWSENYHETILASRNIRAGVVHINSWGEDDIGMPFGGTANSGFAKEKCLASFEQFSYEKLIYRGTH